MAIKNYSNISLHDTVKLLCGTSDDLEIYHDGSNSYISDTGTGSLVIKSSPIVEVKGANDENIARFIENGSVDLYYNNVLKFETTGGGALVIGELEATTLDINGVADINVGSANVAIELTSSDAGCYIRYKDGADANRWYTGVNNGAYNIYNNGNSQILSLDASNNATFAGDVTGVGTLTATTLSVTNYGLASGDIPNNAADTTGNAAFSSKTAVSDHSTNNIDYPVVWHNNANALYDTASKFTFNPSTGALTTTTLSATNYGLASGDIPNNAADTTGNADTATLAADATTLATPRAINGVNFDGSAAITVTAAAGTLSGTELADGVVTSALTSVGTIGTGTWQGTRVASLYLDTDTAHLTTDQTFTGVKTFDETIVGSVNGSAATVTSGSQANITTLAGVTSIGTAGATTNVLAGDLTMYNPVNDGNPTISIGSSATERLEIQAGYESGAQGLDIVRFTTFTAGSGSNDGRYAFEVDDVFLLNILDDGIRIKSSGNLEIGSGNAILSDSSGTTTLSNIDALDATTQNTISATTRQLTHHTIQDDIDTQVVFLSLTEFDSENTTIGNNKLPLIAPVAGKLLKVFVRCSHNLSGVDFTWKLYTRTSSQSTNGNAAEIGAITGTGPTNGNMVTYDFTGELDGGTGTNVIGAGDKVQLSLETDGATSNANFFITLMWEWDLS